MEIEFPVPFQKTGCRIADVDRRGTEATQPSDKRKDTRDVIEIIVGIDIFIHRKSSGKNRTVYRSNSGTMYGLTVQSCATAFFRAEKFTKVRSIDHSHHSLASVFHTYGNAEIRKSRTEIGSSVKRIDDPLIIRVASRNAGFFRQNGMVGEMFAEITQNDTFRGFISLRHNVALVQFCKDLEMIRPEITEQNISGHTGYFDGRFLQSLIFGIHDY